MKHHLLSIVVLSFAALFVAACGGLAPAGSPAGDGDAGPTPPVASGGGPATDYASLVDALRAAGAAVESTGDEIEQPFFAVRGRLLRVNGADVQVFEYASESAAEAESALVAPNGGSVGTSMMAWIAPPHFFKAGRLIALYVGDDAQVVDLLEGALGPQFAGGATA